MLCTYCTSEEVIARRAAWMLPHPLCRSRNEKSERDFCAYLSKSPIMHFEVPFYVLYAITMHQAAIASIRMAARLRALGARQKEKHIGIALS